MLSAFDQYLIFAIGDVHLMLPAESAIKVASASPAACRSLREAGVLPAGAHTVRWLNLHKRIPSDGAVGQHQYLIVVRGSLPGFWGLLADSLPDMGSVDPQSLKELPPTSGDGAMSDIASHVLFDPGGNAYLLDLDKILALT